MLASRRAVLAAAASSLLTGFVPASAGARQQPYKPEVGQPGKDVVWVPTPDAVVEKMLELAQVGRDDYVVDLGSGDGKIAIAAARRGARAKGVEYNPKMVELSKRNAAAAGVRVEFVRGDIFRIDFSKADVLTLYLLPELNERLRPRILAMRPGTRVVSHQFAMGDWEPDQDVAVGNSRVLFWRVPAKVGGQWEVQFVDGTARRTLKVTFDQRYQQLAGESLWEGSRQPLAEIALSGAQLRFAAADANGALHRFDGVADRRGRLHGTVTSDGGAAGSFEARRA
jgi:SAM-dependent methyltransferase